MFYVKIIEESSKVDKFVYLRKTRKCIIFNSLSIF